MTALMSGVVITSPEAGKLLSVTHSTLAAVFVRALKLFEDEAKAVLDADASADMTRDVPATLNFSEVNLILALTIVAP